MTKNLRLVLRRADRALIGAGMLALAVAATGCAAIRYYPHTEELATAIHPAPVPASRVTLALPASFDMLSVVPTPKPSPAEMAKQQILAEHRCLAEALYYEARGEGVEGQEAIAEVVIHRMHDRNFPHTICGVVYQGAGHRGCQFSFTCDGELNEPKSRYAWYEAQLVAARIMTGEIQLHDITEDAVNFHAVYVQPDWANHMVRTIQIGNHIFYRWAHSRAS